MLALIPLLIQFIPDIARWIEGDAAGNVAQKVADVAQSVLGTTDPAAAATLLADQSKVSDLRIALAKIGADVERAKLDAQTAAITAALADIASARTHDIAVRSATGGTNRRADVMLVAVTIGLIACIIAAATGKVEGAVFGLVSGIAGMLSGCFKDAFGFEFGSSRQSEEKTHIIADMGRTMVATDGGGVTRPLV